MSVRTVAPALLKLAVQELGEVPSRRAEDIECIREWLKKNHCLKSRIDNQWILSFLRGCKFSLESTKKKITHYYMMRTVAPEFLTNRDPLLPELQALLQLGVLIPLEKSTDPTAPRVLLLHDCGGGKVVSVTNMVKVALMVMDILVNEDDNFVISGHVVLHNFRSMTLNHAVQLTPALVKNILSCFEHSYPSRAKEFHYINTPSFFNSVFNVVKLFMSEKLQKRVKIYDETYHSELRKSIPKDILPKEYGGEGSSVAELILEG
ncbi:retinol-binding protein pinta-like isoform X2 [Photinus pyralis]|uniref:retinol-binding protein pinta-like isoform X2 n=1 Tax=Photinus pyralis TaxID=7054 RepID=UPI00126738FC|nr:retinol-binding protein pinta-like isoform X2 [Photinus pyralis]